MLLMCGDINCIEVYIITIYFNISSDRFGNKNGERVKKMHCWLHSN